MKRVLIPAVLCMAAALSACGHRTSAEVTSTSPQVSKSVAPKSPAAVQITENDITDRPYVSLGDITVSVSKNNLFESDPNRTMAEAKLRETAAEMGADAVVLARYGAVGVSFFSWGTMEAKGRAVRFTK